MENAGGGHSFRVLHRSKMRGHFSPVKAGFSLKKKELSKALAREEKHSSFLSTIFERL